MVQGLINLHPAKRWPLLQPLMTGGVLFALARAYSFIAISIRSLEKIMSRVNSIQIQMFLRGVDYPTSKTTLIENAKNKGADNIFCSSLDQLPDNDFKSPGDVSRAISHLSDESDRAASSTGNNEFLAQAVQDSMTEIELCELALEKSSDDGIKAFAQQMIDTHSEIGYEIEQLCSARNLDLPKDMKPEQSAMMQQLSELSGQEFDKKFIEHNVEMHENDIKVFKHYAEQKDDEVSALAQKGVKILTKHLNMAKQASKKL
jgi:predicted outer membrane protein